MDTGFPSAQKVPSQPANPVEVNLRKLIAMGGKGQPAVDVPPVLGERGANQVSSWH